MPDGWPRVKLSVSATVVNASSCPKVYRERGVPTVRSDVPFDFR